MKVLFIGSNPGDRGSLALERDITAIQKRTIGRTGVNFEFVFLPSCPLEELPQLLLDIKPDILHFAAHGDNGHLVLADQGGNPRRVSAAMIRAFVDPEHPPLLVFLCACDSAPIAQELAALGIAAFGANVPITNAAARAATVCFYDRISRGFSVRQAHDAAAMCLKAINDQDAETPFYEAAIPVAHRQLVRVPRIIAEPAGKPKHVRRGDFQMRLRFGVLNYPPETQRIAFFSPDTSFGTDANGIYTGVMASFTDNYDGMACWSDEWTIQGDFLLVATGASRTERTFSEAIMASDAIQNCLQYKPKTVSASEGELQLALDLLLRQTILPPPIRPMRAYEVLEIERLPTEFVAAPNPVNKAHKAIKRS